MPFNRSLPLAVAFGLIVGSIVYQFFIPDWYPALGVAAVYTGASYFYFAFDVSLRGTQVHFTDRRDKIGYAVGLFGLSVSPLALGEYTGLSNSAVTGLFIWVMGTIAFLLLSTTAAQAGQSAETAFPK